MFEWCDIEHRYCSDFFIFHEKIKKVGRFYLTSVYGAVTLQVIGQGNGKILTKVVKQDVEIGQPSHLIGEGVDLKKIDRTAFLEEFVRMFLVDINGDLPPFYRVQ
jgi:hypothetical protein